MNLKKRYLYLLYFVLAVSIIGNIMTLSLDVVPTIYPKVKDKYFREETLHKVDSTTKNIVFKAALNMAGSSEVAMVWSEPKGLTNTLLHSRSITSTDDFRKYNYPRAYLFYSISKFLLEDKGDKNKEVFKTQFDKLLESNGNPTFEINRVDQVPFGLASINMYKTYNEEKYLSFADKFYKYTINSIDDTDSIVLYRSGQPTVLNDVLGMVIPFLIEYASVTGKDEPLEIAEKQLEYYIKYGVDKETYLPAHAISRKHLVKVGSANWGRGIGWYYIALSYFYKETGLFEDEYQGLTETLLSLKNSEGLWSQFPGSSEKFDASSTTMFLYGLILNDPENYSSTEVLKSLQNYISETGVILQTSGDTYGTNRYSNTFGESELSQGMLLLILSSLEK